MSSPRSCDLALWCWAMGPVRCESREAGVCPLLTPEGRRLTVGTELEGAGPDREEDPPAIWPPEGPPWGDGEFPG